MLKVYDSMLKPFKGLGGGAIVIVYGSVASGKSRTDSDIDIAVVSRGKVAWEKADSIADKILLEHGKVVSIAKFTPSQFASRENSSFAREVLRGLSYMAREADLKELVEAELASSKERLEAAKLLLSDGKLLDAVNRIYYAAFHAARACS